MLLARRPLTFLACIGGFALAVFIALMPLSSSGLGIEEGEIAIRTIRAPRDISFISDTLTERRQDEAADAVEDTPIFDPSIASAQQTKLRDQMSGIRTIVQDANSAAARSTSGRASPSSWAPIAFATSPRI